MKKNWWKYLTIVLLIYTVVAGFLIEAPRLNILNESIRNLFFHVPMWFGMVIILTGSVIQSVRYLSSNDLNKDIGADVLAKVGIWYGVLGLVTGAVWATYTWGRMAGWLADPKITAVFVTLLIYFAYLLLRSSLNDEQKRARVSAVYNIFAYPLMISLLFILPRLAENSLHPGNAGNPGFNAYDLDSRLRMVFYPAVIGWTLLGYWIATLHFRIRKIEHKLEEE
ncbi:cytochrome c biogenesis protein CcsA [Mangrovivirga sp. M17]|uniref:Cytochrome c biogenesis protein CcsA n=1 Tax=Mangrovivirga halotolerans TaxID=2993936 RepID=A0ABT3RTN3_9BACT|nr:cytochrome c biogenesis protein CcsA [Mangrovivirga halotolerans]MCX2744607.1 cytochrome c biogenesis protein CcsA [Mangrovivirga halotolerans]